MDSSPGQLAEEEQDMIDDTIELYGYEPPAGWRAERLEWLLGCVVLFSPSGGAMTVSFRACAYRLGVSDSWMPVPSIAVGPDWQRRLLAAGEAALRFEESQ